jgi:hypothetical protein
VALNITLSIHGGRLIAIKMVDMFEEETEKDEREREKNASLNNYGKDKCHKMD